MRAATCCYVVCYETLHTFGPPSLITTPAVTPLIPLLFSFISIFLFYTPPSTTHTRLHTPIRRRLSQQYRLAFASFIIVEGRRRLLIWDGAAIVAEAKMCKEGAVVHAEAERRRQAVGRVAGGERREEAEVLLILPIFSPSFQPATPPPAFTPTTPRRAGFIDYRRMARVKGGTEWQRLLHPLPTLPRQP